MNNNKQLRTYSVTRLRFILGLLLAVFIIIIIRLFYLQIIRYDHYINQAEASQIQSLEIEADRGGIYAFNNNKIVPLVLNEIRWTMFSDTKFIEDVDALISALEDLNVDLTDQQKEQLNSDSRFVVLETQVATKRKNYIVKNLKLRGVYFQQKAIRQYIEGDLASHVLGFLNNDSEGQYGIEQYYHQQLTGIPGQLHITTDVHDNPLLFIEDNIRIPPQSGEDIVLTIDVSMQRMIEDELQKGIENIDAVGGTAVLLDADTGAVLAMANRPTFHPAKFGQTEVSLYPNKAVESILEPASTIKVLTMAVALNEGVVDPNDSYNNPASQVIDGYAINNLLYYPPGFTPVTEILPLSLNTGSIEMLKRFDKDGDDTQIDLGDRQIMYDYFTNKFRINQTTGIDLPNEIKGYVREADYPWAPNHLYANMTFGQGLTVTPIQLTTLFGAFFNGGKYYQPYIVDRIGEESVKPTLLAEDILEPEALADLRELMVNMGNRGALQEVQYRGLEISAKTGSAQVADLENGGYLEDVSNGLMAGYIKSDSRTLALVVIIEDPKTHIAGAFGARPVWMEIVKNIVAIGDIY